MKKELLKHLWFLPKENTSEVYTKKYSSWYSIEVDFLEEVFDYWEKIQSESKTTQNFSQEENWVVLECVNRLLEKWYKPEDITLEKIYPSWHGTSGRLDILVKKDWKAFLMIECKTWWIEFEKEFKNVQKKGGQIFTYFQQDRDTEYLVLYASSFNGKTLQFKNEIVTIEQSYRETSNVADLYLRWNKLTKQNGIFEDWVEVYDFESRALRYENLKDIEEEDASKIFNRFLEILRHNTVSDKPNAFNKMFTLFLCKIYDELSKQGTPDELEFQWIEWKDDHVDFQKRLTDLYKKWMAEFLRKQVTDFSDNEFEKQFWSFITDEKVKDQLKKQITKLRLQKNNEFAIKEVFDDASFEENAVVLKEIVELLQWYRFRYARKQPFLWDFFELLLTTGLKQEAWQFFTPVPIARFIAKSIPIESIIDKKLEWGENNDILPAVIDYAAWSGHFIIEWMEEIQSVIKKKDVEKYNLNIKKLFKIWREDSYSWAKDYVYGIERDYRLVRTSKVGCYLHWDGIATVIHGDGLDSFKYSEDYIGRLKNSVSWAPEQNESFDLVLSNPPYSVSAFKGNLKKEQAENDFTLYENLTDNSSEIEALFIERTAQLLKEWWIAAIILPSSILSNTWIYTKAREILLKNFEIVAITELGSQTFMATGTNTITLFMRKRDRFFAKNLELSIEKFFKNLQDVTINGIEKAISKYVAHVWEGIQFSDYITLLKSEPNETIKKHEIFKEYSNKIKLTKKGQLEQQKEFFEKIMEVEKEKLLYFVLTYPQQLILVKSWEKDVEKNFLWYYFSFWKGKEGIHSIKWGKLIDDCTSLFDPTSLANPEKVSTYIYEAFLWNYSREIHENLVNHISRIWLVDSFIFDRAEFEKTLSLNTKKKVKIESKWEFKRLWDICEIKIWWTPSRDNFDYWEKWKNLWVSISEMSGWTINDTKEKINDLWIEKSNVKLIKSWTTLLSFKLSIWKTAIAWKDLYTNEAIAGLCLQNEDHVLNRYLFSLFNSRFIDLEKGNFNAFWKSLNSTFLKEEVKIPLPPLDIQQKIVDEIEVLEKEEQEKKEKVEALKGKIEEIVWWVEWKKQVKIWDIKEELFAWWDLPEWNYIKWLKETEEYKIPIYSNWLEDDWLYWYTNKARVEKECVTISARWTIWFPIERKQPFYPIVRLLVLIPKENLALNKYLVYVIKKLDLKQFWATTPQLTVPQISDFKIPLPSLETQKQIVSQIEKIESEIEILEKDLKQIPEKKQAILTKYL